MRYFSDLAMLLCLSTILAFCTNNQKSNISEDNAEINLSFDAVTPDTFLTIIIFNSSKAL